MSNHPSIIELESCSSGPVWLKPAAITTIQALEDDNGPVTAVSLEGSSHVHLVRQSVEQILALIDAVPSTEAMKDQIESLTRIMLAERAVKEKLQSKVARLEKALATAAPLGGHGSQRDGL